MKIRVQVILTAVILVIMLQPVIKAESGSGPKLKFNSGTDYTKEKLKSDYNRAKRDHAARTGALLGASVDFKLGYGSTNPTVNTINYSGDVSTQSKGGFTFGTLLNISILNSITLTTGLDFINKKFDVGVPVSLDTLNPVDSVLDLANNYLNIPLNVTFGGMVSDKVGLSFTGGPYFGFLLNPSAEVSAYKDFDLGLNGVLTANYLLNPFMSILLGTEVQYGGLNNLISSGNVDSAHTLNWNAFTGLRIGFDF